MDLATSQVDKMISPPGRSSEGLWRCGRGEEVAQTDGGDGDGVVVVRVSRTAHPSPQGAHNLTRRDEGKDAMVDVVRVLRKIGLYVLKIRI